MKSLKKKREIQSLRKKTIKCDRWTVPTYVSCWSFSFSIYQPTQRAILPELKKAVLPELVWPSTSHISARAGPRHITCIILIIYLPIIVPSSQTMAAAAAAAALFMSHGRHCPTRTPTANFSTDNIWYLVFLHSSYTRLSPP